MKSHSIKKLNINKLIVCQNVIMIIDLGITVVLLNHIFHRTVKLVCYSRINTIPFKIKIPFKLS